jgi:hypothetical protein
MSTVLAPIAIDTAATPRTAMLAPGRTARLTPSLYDLIVAVQHAVEPGDEILVVATVWHLLHSRRLTWAYSKMSSSHAQRKAGNDAYDLATDDHTRRLSDGVVYR